MYSLIKNVRIAVLHYRQRPPSTFLYFLLIGSKIVLHLKAHARLAAVLKPFLEHGLIPAKISFVYLFKYLSTKLTTKEKLGILTHHYYFLTEMFPAYLFQQIFTAGLICWQKKSGNHNFDMTISSPSPYEEEGSLNLTMRMDNRIVYSLSFSFAAGSLWGLNDKNIIYISRIQGANGQLDLISKCAKIFSDNNPSVLLISAMEGLALSLRIDRIVGINAYNQIGYSENRINFIKSYNTFWETFEVNQLLSNDYAIAVPLKTKDLQLIKSRRRKRTIKKRIVRNELCSIFYQNVHSILINEVQPEIAHYYASPITAAVEVGDSRKNN